VTEPITKMTDLLAVAKEIIRIYAILDRRDSAVGHLFDGSGRAGFYIDPATNQMNQRGPAYIGDILTLKPISRPGLPKEGMIYPDKDDNHVYCYLGGAWKQLD
jgi:hypothetical protein